MSKDWNKCVEIVFNILSFLTEKEKEKNRKIFGSGENPGGEKNPGGGEDFYVFGGYVRDLLQGKSGDEICDLDLRIESRDIADNFLDMVKMCGMLQSYERKVEDYGLLKMVLVLPGSDVEYELDINNPHEDADRTKMLCDFTCNNLCLYPDGSIKTRYYPGKITGGSEQAWLTKCIRDATTGTLCWMIPQWYATDFSKQEDEDGPFSFSKQDEAEKVMTQMKKRVTKMLKKGFRFPKDKSSWSVTGFVLKTNNYQDQDNTCFICFDSSSETILECGHQFHTKCLKQYSNPTPIRKNRKCPCCCDKTIVQYFTKHIS